LVVKEYVPLVGKVTLLRAPMWLIAAATNDADGPPTRTSGAGDDVATVNPVAPATATITGDVGNDTLDAGSAGGGALLRAGDGDDKLISGRHSGDDILDGGPGADVFSLKNDHNIDSLECGPGDDQIIGAVFGQDTARDDCPPVDAIRFASRGRVALAGARRPDALPGLAAVRDRHALNNNPIRR
jgi:hypothetical protein